MSEPRQQPREEPMSKERLRLWLRLLRATRMIEGELRERLRSRHNTTLPRFDVMAALYRHEKGLRMSALSSELMVSNGNVTGIVERLVSEGLVMRHAVEGDRRATVVRLTRKGREDFAALAGAHEAWLDEMLGALTATDTSAMLAQMDALLQALDAEGDKP